MGKKKRTSQRIAAETPVRENPGESRKRIRTFEDVADSDDEFHLNRDRVLLEEEPAAKKRRKIQEEEAFLEASEEEVLADSDVDLEDDDAEVVSEDDADEAQDDEDDEEGWGTSRFDTYGADAIETEEQALEEEAEARRLQKKQLQGMSTADYGFEEEEWKEATRTDEPTIVTERLPELEVPSDATPTERMKMLRARYPEFEPLSKELLQLSATVNMLANTLSTSTTTMPRTGTKYNAASAYLGALTVYFALLTAGKHGVQGKALAANELHNHDIMATLVGCRTLWESTKELAEDEIQWSEVNGSPPELVQDSDDESLASSPKAPAKSRKARHEEALQAAKQTRIAEKLRRMEAENADLDLMLGQHPRRALKVAHIGDDGDLGGEVPLTAAQAEEKAKRRKSLRFYTSQIAQKANKRGAAGRTAGGDDDIPHRERLRDRQTRLNAEAEKRGKRGTGEDLGGASDDEDAEQARKIRQAVDEDDDYYDMVAAKTAKKKSDKIAYGEAQKRANEQGGVVIEQEVVGADGKRKISYAIEKNKGLTPHRKKDVRNPRVKKRKKFEEKTKKLASMKATYKGGEGRGGYGGELTGIKANLVKSVKL